LLAGSPVWFSLADQTPGSDSFLVKRFAESFDRKFGTAVRRRPGRDTGLFNQGNPVMFLPASLNGSAGSRAPDIDPGLLRDTQLYLEYRCRRQPALRAMRQAWDRFYRIYAPLLRRFALRYRLQPAELEDCLQEVWRELVVQLRTFRYDPGRGRFDAWLHTLVRSKATDLVRRGRRHPTESLHCYAEERLLGRDVDPATIYEHRCQQELVRYALTKLRRRVSPYDYQLFDLKWIKGWTVAEIASSLDLTPEHVSRRLHRVKKKLRSLICLCNRKDTLRLDGNPKTHFYRPCYLPPRSFKGLSESS
jgi:RNA polymerase sigma factor (sigma-70 family)